MADEAERLVKAETAIENLREDIGTVNQRLQRHGEQIDGLASQQQEMKTDLIVIRKDIETISGGVNRVEVTVNKTADKLEHLQDERINDHYKKPVENYRKVIWQVIVIFVGLVATFLLGSLFPVLIK